MCSNAFICLMSDNCRGTKQAIFQLSMKTLWVLKLQYVFIVQPALSSQKIKARHLIPQDMTTKTNGFQLLKSFRRMVQGTFLRWSIRITLKIQESPDNFWPTMLINDWFHRYLFESTHFETPVVSGKQRGLVVLYSRGAWDGSLLTG